QNIPRSSFGFTVGAPPRPPVGYKRFRGYHLDLPSGRLRARRSAPKNSPITLWICRRGGPAPGRPPPKDPPPPFGFAVGAPPRPTVGHRKFRDHQVRRSSRLISRSDRRLTMGRPWGQK